MCKVCINILLIIRYLTTFQSYLERVSDRLWHKPLRLSQLCSWRSASSGPDPLPFVHMWKTTCLASHRKQKQKWYVELLGSQNGLFPLYTSDWSSPGSEQWSVPCTRLHSEEAERQIEPAQWRQEGLYACGSPLARVPRARVKADGMWKGLFERTSCLFRLGAPFICPLTSLRQGEHKKRPRVIATVPSKHYCLTNLNTVR